MITDINIYKLFKFYLDSENRLDEGLILTHDPYISIDILERFIKTNDIANSFDNIIEYKDEHIEFIAKGLKTEIFIKLLTLINNLGYYISEITCILENGMEKKYIWSEFKEYYFNKKILKNIHKFKLQLEAKFGTSKTLKNTTIFHVTEEQYINSIFKNGLIPKTKNVIKEHPERIYVTLDVKSANKYIGNKSEIYIKNVKPIPKFIILEINLLQDLNIYEDPNFKEYGYYTYDNISPEIIKIYKK